MNIEITNIYFLFLGGIIVFIIFVLFLTKKTQQNFSDIALIQRIYGGNTVWYNAARATIILSTFLVFFILSEPYIKNLKTQTSRDGIDIEIILDVSLSMLADDMGASRLELAKKSVIEFIESTYSDRIGIILFSGKPFHSVPLTYDYDFLSYFIDGVNIDTINKNISELQGTAIGDSLLLGVDILTREEIGREKIILLITDGVANTGINPDLAKKYALENAIKIYTIGIGRDDNASVRIPGDFGITNIVQVGPIDEESLKSIAEITGGKYYKAENSDMLREVLGDIGKLEKTPLITENIQYNTSLRRELLIILLCIQLFLGYILYIRKIRI